MGILVTAERGREQRLALVGPQIIKGLERVRSPKAGQAGS